MAPINRSTGRTLQDQVVASVLEQIRSGALSPGDPLMPERQMSEQFGVSRITVVRALDKLASDGWVSRQQGRGTFVCEPPTPQGPAIALLAAVPAHPSLFRSLIGMSEVINAANGQLRLLGSFEGLGSEREMVDRALRDGANGLIIYPDTGLTAPPLYHELIARDVPLVLIDRYFPDLATNRVIYDDEAAGADLCGRLFDGGVSRIAVLPHREFDVTSVRDRIAGARRAAATRGLPEDSIVVWPEVYADFSPSRPQAALSAAHVERLAARLGDGGVDGFFAINGDVADRLSRNIQTLRSSGHDLGAYRLCACVHRPVDGTTDQPILMAHENAESLGRRAGEMLTSRIREGTPFSVRTVKVKMQIDGGS